MELTEEKLRDSYFGAIPEDWLDCTFVDVIDGFSSGMTPYRGISEYYKGNIPWITSGELNYNVIEDTVEKITPEAIQKTNLKILPVGTFLMAITGLEAAGTRGSCGITGVKATTNQSCMALFPKEGKIITEYLYHFYVQRGNELAFKFCQGTKQQSYTGRIAKLLPIILPPTLTEQKAIATALSEVDALISSLDKLITKKKAIKKGAMQELLTPPHKGGKRLPGFSGEWEENQLGELCSNISSGSSNTTSITGIFPLYGSTGQIGTKDYNDYSGDRILVARVGANAGSLYKVIGDYCVSDNTLMLSVCKEIDINFLFFLLKKYNLTKLIFGSGQPLVTGGQLKEILLFLPKKEEQKTISQILTDIDLEIESLENKKAKYQEVKQGMMQELLTGKTRLV